MSKKKKEFNQLMNVVFDIKSIKEVCNDISFMKFDTVQMIQEKKNGDTIWRTVTNGKVKRVKLDNYDTIMCFPFYLRQLIELAYKKDEVELVVRAINKVSQTER